MKTTPAGSYFNEFGILHVARGDFESFAAQWTAEHGQPRDSGDVFRRDQWVDQQVAALLARSEWAVFYETAIVARFATEREARIEHDVLVCRGLNPDKLAYGEV